MRKFDIPSIGSTTRGWHGLRAHPYTPLHAPASSQPINEFKNENVIVSPD